MSLNFACELNGRLKGITMKSCLIKLGMLTLLLLLGGCSSTLKPTTLKEDGYFDTSSTLRPEGVIIEQPFKPEYRKMLYVKTGDEKNERYKEFYLTSFKNMNAFDKVVDQSELESLVIEQGLTDKVSNISDKIGLHHLQKEMGSFLVVEPYVEWNGGYDYVANLKAYDPESGKVVLHIEKEAFNWAGLDDPLFYPLLNGFVEWTRGEKISTKAAPNKK